MMSFILEILGNVKGKKSPEKIQTVNLEAETLQEVIKKDLLSFKTENSAAKFFNLFIINTREEKVRNVLSGQIRANGQLRFPSKIS